MKIRERQSKLIEIVRRKEKASVDDLAMLLGASRETIRRDLTALAELGKILKVHGGAKMPSALGEGPFKQRMSENVDAKMKIAQCASVLFQPGETLFVDTGSTTLLFVEALANAQELTIITNSTEIARTVASNNQPGRVFLLGGEYSAGNSQTIGAMASTQVRAFRAHHAILTIGALDKRSGAMDYNIDEAQIARAMIAQSESVTVLADFTKLGALASFEVCPLSAIDRLVTDQSPPDGILQSLEAAGVQVVIPS